MPKYLQADRPLSVTTPLAADTLKLTGLRGHEAISSLFHYDFELVAENEDKVPFDSLLGQKVTAKVRQQDQEIRYFSGIVSRVSQGARDGDFTEYRLEVVPQFWLLTNIHQSRIFQHITVPNILKQVLEGLDVTYEIQGTFEERDYCVQYRESDFDFASRLMEEEGIYYFFKHTSSSHTMVVANTPQSHIELNPAKAIYEGMAGGNRPEGRVLSWEKTQELRSGKTTLRDFNFELPHDNLEAAKNIVETVQAGTVSHKFKVAHNDKLEIYDYPGEYATRFDGVDRGGAPRASDLQKIFQDNQRTVAIRMQERAVQGLVIQGESSCVRMTAGYKFTLERHFDANGVYVLTSVETRASLTGDYRSGDTSELEYENGFTCIPFVLPFRPARVTPAPHVHGAQTATVVGPGGEEIFTDKYGRIKVQFNWDRQGRNDGNSSCWLRVATSWAGKQWGVIHIPRIGQEVIVDFVDGRLDDPIVVGSVYNPGMMPPFPLPAEKTKSGIQSRSTLQGGASNFNMFMFEDKKGSELVHLHAEKDLKIDVENDENHDVGHDRTRTVKNKETVTIKDSDQIITLNKGNRAVTIEQGNDSLDIKQGNRDVKIEMGNDSLKISMGNRTTKLDLGKDETEAMQSIELKVGQSSVKLDQSGVTIKGIMVQIEGQAMLQGKAPMTQVSGDAMLTLKGGITMIN